VPYKIVWSLFWLCCVPLITAGCHRAPAAAAKAAPASKVTGGVKEDQLTTIELTEAAVKRLGVETTEVKSKSLPRRRVYGGEVTLPVGAAIIVSAPVAGTLQPPTDADVPRIGGAVREKQVVFRLLPLLSPERAVLTPAERIRFAEARNTIETSRIDAAGLVSQGEVQVDAARVALERAQRLLKDSVGTARAVDEAQAQLDLATKALAAAKARKKQLDAINLDGESPGVLAQLAIESPMKGIIRAEHALPGEVVAAGAPLFEVMSSDALWIRVPVYVGEISEIAVDHPADIGPFASRPDQRQRHRTVQPVSAPPSATALASTVDLYYELTDPHNQFRPGERVSVSVPLAGEQEQIVIPWSAVVQDIYGGSWVYEAASTPRTYIRRRVQVKQVIGDLAVLDQGPPAGTKVVTTAVAEIFGTEFGFGK
jgi:membrane fusion protein, heavy metal efflux system